MFIDSHCHLNYKGLVESQAEVLRRAREAFGPAGAGLRLASAALLSASYSHASGHVSLTIEPGHGENTVVIETREFDAEVVRFIAALPRRGWIGQLARRFRRSKT